LHFPPEAVRYLMWDIEYETVHPLQEAIPPALRATSQADANTVLCIGEIQRNMGNCRVTMQGSDSTFLFDYITRNYDVSVFDTESSLIHYHRLFYGERIACPTQATAFVDVYTPPPTLATISAWLEANGYPAIAAPP
jgi:hypothetical protein